MKLQIIATRDIVANVYGQPMFVVHIGQAIRSFGDECTREDKNNVLWQHPEDFELWHLGEWDDETARFDTEHDGSHTTPKQIAVGANYRRTK